METSWPYVKRLVQRSEELGYDLTLIAELFLNDIKGADAPSLDALTTTAALAAITEKLELMVADDCWPLPKYREMLFPV